MRAVGSHLKAVLVFLHLVAITLAAMPAPVGALRRAEWKDPTVQEELQLWTSRLQGWGMDISLEELEDRAWGVARSWLAGRRKVLSPFRPYFRYCGTHQSWRMFVAPHRYPSRLHIDLKTDGVWKEIYVGRDPELNWHAEWMDHDRMRSVIFRFGWTSYRADYGRFSRWLAEQAAQEFPDATHLRVRLFKSRTLSPAEVLNGDLPKGSFRLPRVIALNEFREDSP